MEKLLLGLTIFSLSMFCLAKETIYTSLEQVKSHNNTEVVSLVHFPEIEIDGQRKSFISSVNAKEFICKDLNLGRAIHESNDTSARDYPEYNLVKVNHEGDIINSQVRDKYLLSVSCIKY